MDKFSCNLCEKIESFVHMCEEKHFVCERCVDVMTQDDLPHLCSVCVPIANFKNDSVFYKFFISNIFSAAAFCWLDRAIHWMR